ncbi:hypothetical protein QSH57_002002 [Fusarium oxysporum f. sp. vasinfectum]|nr:hypothetical protein QSH57_002002 [Fusarium oxysporum f. sp. vasinfectum]
MADPLSIASGVAGLVSLGLTLCNGLHNYLSAVKDRYSDIETATQGLALLQSNICIIQSSTLKLGHRHALAANGVNLGLRNCETQLRALENFVEDLTTAPSLSGAKQKWQKQKMFIRYPFDQKKLFQLQEQLSKANSTLGSFVQSFNLDLNIGISDDLQVLKREIHANDSVTHATLRMISNQLCSISSVGQSTNVGMATSFTLVDDQPVATNKTAAPDLETAYLARSAGHTLTMLFLGIRHLPIYDFVDTGGFIFRSRLPLSEEWTEILDEDRLLIEQLHALDREFEEAFLCRNESVADFIRGYWWRRMKDVKRDLDRPLSSSDKLGLLEVGVLLKESTESSFDSDLDEITTSEDEYEHNDMSD